ncbi:MAG: phosphoribosylformylglycinamidine synthase subunit PurQ [Acidimicrobiaceae bacterium]|nr:phosphoribosylformylglycinamidine synthase subunit PurQ [Acidimicrobiaceae bacterium]
MSRPPVLILHAPGTNRDTEAAAAVQAAGGDPRIVAASELINRPGTLSRYAAVLLPGGFSYGDALGAGGRLALELRSWLGDELAAAAGSGRPILGICNGFQALVKSGLLNAGEGRPFTLAANTSGRFECRWVTLSVEPGCRSSWLEPLRGSVIRCPVAHGEGRLAARYPEVVHSLEKDGRIAFRYLASGSAGGNGTDPAAGTYPANPNGSDHDTAGLCDATGTVVGLMPHPEDHIVDWQRPSGPPGARGSALFEALVDAAQ